MKTEFFINTTNPQAPVISLTGKWTTGGRLPEVSVLKDVIQSSLNTVQLVPGENFEWDSRLMAFILATERLCSEQNKKLDISALPVAVQQLHDLANAVPPDVSSHQDDYDHWQLLKDARKEIVETLGFIGEMCLATVRLFSGRSHMRIIDLVSCLNQAGPKAIGILSLLSVLVGMILAYLGMIQLSQFGAEVYVANLVALGMVREMGSLMTAVIMAGRTGAAWASELGAMQVNEEVDALETMGIHPVDFLVMPRLLAMAIAMPLLSAYSFVLGMIGGGVMTTGMDMTLRMYLHQLLQSFSPGDVLAGCFKGFVFGLLIVVAGCQAGMNCRGSSAAVGKATTRAVVQAIVYCVVADAALNLLYYKLGI